MDMFIIRIDGQNMGMGRMGESSGIPVHKQLFTLKET